MCAFLSQLTSQLAEFTLMTLSWSSTLIRPLSTRRTCTVLAAPPALIGEYAANNPDYIDYRLGDNGIFSYSPYTPLANLAGAPAASLPVHLTAEGLPIGIQIMAPIGRDDVVIEASARYEREIGFTS